MGRIKQLPPAIFNKIAAGEVIERPASVVKELLENSIDAEARRIEIDIEQGGVDLIRVVDDGGGIQPEDLPLAIASHATSKLQTPDDLFQIGTLGFRGEALASVASISHLTIQSRPADASTGAELICDAGAVLPVRPWNGAAGTRVEVRRLFCNVPVRRKFLRSTSTELGHITETLTRISLAQPRLTFHLRHNGKPLYSLPAGDHLSGGTLRERIGLFFGREVRDVLYEVEAVQGLVSLCGFIADPSCDRGHARMQYLFVNGRWIRDRTLGHALQEAYRGLLMTGRYAVAFLFLEMPPELVDVNVHPTKAEVRFQNAQQIHHLVYSAVKERLRSENLVARLQVPTSTLGTPHATNGGPVPAAFQLSAPPPPQPDLPLPSPTSSDPLPLVVPVLPAPASPPPPSLPEPVAERAAPPTPPWPRPADLNQAQPAKVIQLYDAYLVVETPEGMLVIDQHALHERILFEQFKKRLRTGSLETQRLLIPEPVELTAEQAARLLEQRQALLELGLEIEEFGGSTLLLRSYPSALGRRSPAVILRAVVDHLMTRDRVPAREVLFNDLLSLMACHAAVRAGDRLTPEAMNALIAQRHLAEDVHHCPHGRPTALLFTRQDLEKQFGRI